MEHRATYQIKIGGQLDEGWSDWFAGMTVATGLEPDGTPITILTGAADQAALHGILLKIRNLNLRLIAVNAVRVQTDAEENREEE